MDCRFHLRVVQLVDLAFYPCSAERDNNRILARPDFSIDTLRSLPIPAMGDQARDTLAAAFARWGKDTLQPLPKMNDDPVRVALDQCVADALGLDAGVDGRHPARAGARAVHARTSRMARDFSRICLDAAGRPLHVLPRIGVSTKRSSLPDDGKGRSPPESRLGPLAWQEGRGVGDGPLRESQEDRCEDQAQRA